MAEETVRLSRKNQIVIPREARRRLGLSSGDELLVRVEKDLIVMKPKPRSYTKYMQGLHKEVWKGIEPSRYVEKERKRWSTEKPTSRALSKGIER